MFNFDTELRIEHLNEIAYHLIHVIRAQIINKNIVRDDSNTESMSLNAIIIICMADSGLAIFTIFT